MILIGIYQIRNVINEKIYIGSAINIDRRWNEHVSLLKRTKHHSRHLQSAWNKYGEENFEFSILEECEKEQLVEREQYYIDSVCPEYNICKKAYSKLGTRHTEESRLKMSLANIGKHLSFETREKMSLARKNVSVETREKISRALKGHKRGMLGKHHSEETCMKMSLALTGNKNHNEKRASEEARAKMSLAQKGKTVSLEARLKISRAQKGKIVSQETRDKISLTLKKKYAAKRLALVPMAENMLVEVVENEPD